MLTIKCIYTNYLVCCQIIAVTTTIDYFPFPALRLAYDLGEYTKKSLVKFSKIQLEAQCLNPVQLYPLYYSKVSCIL